jgi:hypothetical protein
VINETMAKLYRHYMGYDRDEGKNCTYPPQTVVLQQKILAPAAPG